MKIRYKSMMTLAILLPVTAMAYIVKSPSQNVVVETDVVDGKPYYKVDYKGKTVIKPSHLGLRLVDAPDLNDGFKVAGFSESTFDETWAPVWGENDSIRNHYNEFVLELERPDGLYARHIRNEHQHV